MATENDKNTNKPAVPAQGGLTRTTGLAEAARMDTAKADALKEKKAEQSRKSRRRNRQLLGFFLSLLVIIGAFSIIQRGVAFMEELFDNTTERENYQQRVEVMVWFDFLPFQDIRQVDQNALKQISIWSIYNRREKEGTIERNENDEALISEIEINRHAAGLFGNDFRFPPHMSFIEPISGMEYAYDPTRQAYAMPITSPDIFYYPQVVDIQREDGGRRRVSVAYLAAMTEDGNIIRNPEENPPSKYMDYIFQRDGRDYYLVAMEPSINYTVDIPVTTPSATPALTDDTSSDNTGG